MQKIRIGSRCISLRSWLTESGGLNTAFAMTEDLTTILADRDRDDFGMDVFARDPGFFKRSRRRVNAPPRMSGRPDLAVTRAGTGDSAAPATT